MRLSTIVLIVLLILALYYYTAETFEIVETVGRHVYDFFTGMYTELQDETDRGKFNDPLEDLKKLLQWLKNAYSK